MRSIATYLLFVGDQAGKAEEAINLYLSLFARSEWLEVERYTAADAPEIEGSIKSAKFTLSGSLFMAEDSALKHEFSFTPAVSMFVECESAEEMENAYRVLLDQGKVLLPLDDYDFNKGFSKKFAWISDRYGVSWQLNLV